MVMEAAGAAASAVGEALGLLKPDKAKLVCVGSNMPAGDFEVEAMFNPTTYTLRQQAQVNRNDAPATPGGTAEFGGTGAMTLTTQLFFDDFGSMKGDVTPKINTLLSWTRPTPDSLRDGRPCPPLVAFRWGGNSVLDDFSGYLTSVTANYLIFRKDGTPVQAKVDIVLTGQPEPEQGQNPTSHSSNSRRVHTMIDGDTLQSVAYKELGKPAYWRAIAELNGLDDPLRITAGTVLLIPSLADAVKGG